MFGVNQETVNVIYLYIYLSIYLSFFPRNVKFKRLWGMLPLVPNLAFRYFVKIVIKLFFFL